MYEDKTYSVLLNGMLAEASSNVAKYEGSLLYNALASLAYELERLYIQADYIISLSDVTTADYESMVKIAAGRGIYPKSATHAVMKGLFDVPVAEGARFNLKGFNYVVQGQLTDEPDYTYKLMCEETGSGPNGLIGSLTAITYVEGLASAEITELLVAGEDAETRDALYQRYLESFSSDDFAGNVAAYEQYFSEYEGIADSKIYPVWNGAGTVKAVLIGSDYLAPSDYLIEQVTAAVMPETGMGYGFAPIGHDVTIEPVEEVTVEITTTIIFSEAYSYEILQEQIQAAIEAYVLTMRKGWADSDGLIMYISRLESAILDVQGILDVTGTTLNGVASNLILGADQIPVIGGIIVR